jgi:16S rRNA (guanine527-N7)-methyltransferase
VSRPAAEALFGDRLPLAEEYARLLVTDGVVRGLVGPREAPRIWDRHLLNCAAVAELIPVAASVIDVGSGAGLPGVALALARPDLQLWLLESKERAALFLTEVVGKLDLEDRVSVVHARAEESLDLLRPATVVVARALGPLDRVAGWCLPLTTVGGRVLAIKGAAAEAEVAAHTATIRRLGGGQPTIRQCGVGQLDRPTTVVEIVRERPASGRRSVDRRRGGRASGRRR